MPRILRSVPRLRSALVALPLTLLVTGSLVAACSSDDSTPGPAASADAAPNDATMSMSTPSVDAATDEDADDGATCDASVAAVISAAANSPYAACASCLERACNMQLQQCYTDCSCASSATSLFTCIAAGGSPQLCATSLISGGSTSSDFTSFVQCAFNCGTLCLPNTNVTDGGDAGTDASADAASDAAADAADASDAGDAGDAGDANTK